MNRRMKMEPESVTRARNRFKNVLRQERYRNDNDDYDSTDYCSGADDCACGGCPASDLSDDVPCTNGHQGKRLKLDKKTLGPAHNAAGVPKKTNLILKMFDRTVDLSPFDESSPLYAICRDWLKNKPQMGVAKAGGGSKDDTTAQEEDADENSIWELPPPKPMLEHYDEHGNRLKGRVPPPLRPADDPNSIWTYIHLHATGEDTLLPSPAALFQNHLNRWNLIRQRWNQATAYNQDRYQESFDIIRNLYKD